MTSRLAFSACALAGGVTLSCVALAHAARSAPLPAGGSAARGGTLRIDLASDFDFVDPNLANSGSSAQMLKAVCAPLYRYPDLDGRAGLKLVLGTAAAFPRVSSDGKRVVIPVRPGYARFWTGAPVGAASYASALQRALDPAMQSPQAPLYADVVGAADVLAKKATRARGIVSRGNTLVLRLVRPVPDLVARLAGVCPQPGSNGLPRDPSGSGAPFNGGGPYVLRRWISNRMATLDRNPYWRGAIAKTRPAYVDRIEYTIGVAPATTKLRLDSDQTDLGAAIPTPAFGELAARYGINRGRFFVRKANATWFFVFNHDRPLFGPRGSGAGNVALKRAINVALDRPALARQFGYLAGVRTDQFLPYNMPGFRNWDIYPLRGADAARARRLAEGHTRDGKLVLYTFAAGPGPGLGEVVRENLQAIGLEVEVRPFIPPLLFGKIGTRGEPFDMAIAGWQAEYPDPITFMRPLLWSGSISDTNGTNTAYFASARFDRLLERASTLGGPERLAAFTNLDRVLMRDLVPVAPFLNTNDRIYVSESVGCFTYTAAEALVNLAALCKK